MTYLQFLATFVLPPLLVVIALTVVGPRTPLLCPGLAMVTLLVFVALVWTTPWDSWIISQGVWSYPPDRVITTVLLVLIEEYLFMAGQTALVGLWTLRVLHLGPGVPRSNAAPRRTTRSAVVWGAGALLGLGLALHDEHGTYLGSMLLWFGPLVALQQAVGADVLRAQWGKRALAFLICWAYLCAADSIAIAANVWHISPAHTYGWSLLGLPVEECLFFAITSLLVVNAIVLGTDRLIRQRLLALVYRSRPRRTPAETGK